jgi:hypothetical protein
MAEAVGVGLGFLAIVAPEFWPKMPKALSYTLAAIGLSWLTFSLILGIESLSHAKLHYGPLGIIILGAVLIACGLFWHISRLDHPAVTEVSTGKIPAPVEVYLSESLRLRAKEVPGKTYEEFNALIPQYIDEYPTQVLRLKWNEEKTILNVIVKNTSDKDIKDARITIGTNIPIVPRTEGAKTFSGVQIYYDITILSFGPFGSQHFFTLEVPIKENRTRFCVTVGIMAEAINPFAAVVCMGFIRDDPPK